MALQTLTNEGYYRGSQTFLGTGNANSVSISTNGGVGSAGNPSVDVTLDNTTGLVVGMLVTGDGLVPSTAYTIAQIVNGTDIKLDVAAVIADDVILTFTPIANAKFDLTTSNFDPLPTEEGQFSVHIDNVLQNATTYSYSSPTLTFVSVPASGSIISVELAAYDREYGSYQSIKLDNIVNNFIISYVGEGKIIPKAARTDVAFHAQRAIQELSYDTLKSSNSQEIEIPPSLTMALPHDYVNYVKIAWIDSNGVECLMHPTRATSNPNAVLQDSDYNYIMAADGSITYAENSETWNKYKSNTTSESTKDKVAEEELEKLNQGGRFGINPENAQDNGIFFIDNNKGRIHFSSNVAGKVITLHYISDGVSTDNISVHKFAEEAVYKYIAYAILSTRINIPEYVVRRFKKERFAEIRKAKLRLSNLKTEALTQVMRGKSKVIKS